MNAANQPDHQPNEQPGQHPIQQPDQQPGISQTNTALVNTSEQTMASPQISTQTSAAISGSTAEEPHMLHDTPVMIWLQAAITRCNEARLKGRKAACWGLFKVIEDDLYACVLCTRDPNRRNAKHKKEKKGQVTYRSSIGTNSMKRHLKEHHKEKFLALAERLEEMDAEERGATRPKKKQKRMTNFFKTHHPYGEESIQQRVYNHDLIVCIGKTGLPLRIVDDPYFRRYVHGRNLRVRLPNRRQLTDTLIPTFVDECLRNYVFPRLTSCASVSITFDLWMSRGCQDIFDLIAHGMDAHFTQHHIHLKMVECNQTTGAILADVLHSVLEKYGMKEKVISVVKDGGSNLTACTNILKNVVSCQALNLPTCFEGRCIAHILAGACNAALASETTAGLASINFQKARSALQNCITWTKKSGKGREEWYKACREMKKKERVMPTPVKTRFVSTVFMLAMMIQYRDVVERCYSSQPQLRLRQRVPQPEVWEIAGAVVIILEPIMKACYLNQRKDGWLLSDSVANIANLYIHYKSTLATLSENIAESSMETFKCQLKIFKRNMCKVLCEKLKPIIDSLLTFQGMDTAHHFLALALDPEYKKMRTPFMKLHTTDSAAARALVQQYDNDVLVPMLVSIRKRKQSQMEHSGNNNNEQSDVFAAPSNSEPEADIPETEELEEDCEDCFINGNNESEETRARREMETELSLFRRESYRKSEQDKFQWLSMHRGKFPHVIEMPQHILAIPATQIDNERIFSMAGRFASPLRNRISTENIDNLICIVQNYPGAKDWDPQQQNVNTMTDFSDFLVQCEVTDDEGNE